MATSLLLKDDYNHDLVELLLRFRHIFHSVLPHKPGDFVKLDLSLNNLRLQELDFDDTENVDQFIRQLIFEGQGKYGYGGYGEERAWYKRGGQFCSEEEVRSIHLGIDLWAPAGTQLYTPYTGTVHSFRNNDLKGDYGPTIILEHYINSRAFYSLYGHLSLESIQNLEIGQQFLTGAPLAQIGEYPVNGDWPPHLHIQLIDYIGDHEGDFPGVAYKHEQRTWLTRCPNPARLYLGVRRYKIIVACCKRTVPRLGLQA